jgi:hypothetical protein
LDPNKTTEKKVWDSSSIFPFALLRPANSRVPMQETQDYGNFTKEVAIDIIEGHSWGSCRWSQRDVVFLG